MSEQPATAYAGHEAATPWTELSYEIVLLVLSGVVPTVSLLVDLNIAKPEWFQRSGAVMVLLAGLLAYRSLTRHYRKFFNDTLRGYPLRTSPNQRKVDSWTLFVSVLGTLVWAYGDLVFR